MEARLRCMLSRGQFSSELAVVIRSSSGREFSLFAQKSDLKFDELPTESTSVSGWINVTMLQCECNLCLVRLPQTTIENGQYLTVAADQLEMLSTGRPTGASA